jgi:TonB family protein
MPERTLGVLEILVDPTGHVESVRLRSPGNRYRERWWVFAAKNWEFKPAFKDGQPVRFLKRITITQGPSDPQ